MSVYDVVMFFKSLYFVFFTQVFTKIKRKIYISSCSIKDFLNELIKNSKETEIPNIEP